MDLPTLTKNDGLGWILTVPAGGLSLPSVTLPAGTFAVSDLVAGEVQAYLRQCVRNVEK